MRIILIFIVSILLLACTSKTVQVSCTDFLDIEIQQYFATNPSLEDTVLWVEDRYETDAVETYNGASSSSTRWHFQDKEYVVYYVNNNLESVTVRLDHGYITIGELFNCIGEPDLYNATYHQGEVGHVFLSLWYPEQNIVVTKAHFGRLDSIVINEIFWMDTITFLPSTLRQKIENGETVIVNTRVSTRNLKPWVNGWSAIEIDQEQ
jgi:hypothetical protein